MLLPDPKGIGVSATRKIMKKEINNNGKGKRPIIGYNPKNWYANFKLISWNKPKPNKKKYEYDKTND